MIFFLYILFVLLFIYSVLFLSLAFFFNKKDVLSGNTDEVPVSIIIPFRNEEKNLGTCINSILNQTYNNQLIEIICVNDHSTDTSLAVLSGHNNIKVISLSKDKTGKKSALTAGIEASKNELIIFRDADTYSEPNWLSSLISKQKENDVDFLIAPVKYTSSLTFLAAIQVLEHFAITYTGAAIAKFGKPILCNGANLLVKKSAFKVVNGFSSNEFVSSGDDIFLMNSLIQAGKKIDYVHSLSAAVICKTEQTLSSFFAQRIRWASKNKHNKNPYNFIIAFLVVAVNCGLLITAIASYVNTDYCNYLLAFSIVKLAVDSIVIIQSALYFKQLTMLCWLPLFFCIFPFEIIIILTLNLFLQPHWKGRKLNK